MDKDVYICTGSCEAKISQERYDQGLTKCGTKDCSMFSQPFKKMKQCRECSTIYEQDYPHTH